MTCIENIRKIYFSLLTQKMVNFFHIQAIQFDETSFTCTLHDRIQLTIHHVVGTYTIDPINGHRETFS